MTKMLYDESRLIEQTRALARDFHANMGRGLGVASILAVHDAARLLGLEQNPKKEVGVDLIGRDWAPGARIQVKGRVVPEGSSGQRIGRIPSVGPWQHVLLVLFSEAYEPREIFAATRAQLHPMIDGQVSQNKRGSLSVAKFKAIGERVWEAHDQG